MSQIDRGFQADQIPRASSAQPGPLGIVEPFASPGLSVQGPGSQAATLYQQVREAMGTVGETAGAVAHYERVRQADQEHIAEIDRAHAAGAGAQYTPEAQAAIARRDAGWIVPDNQTVHGFVLAKLNEQTDGMSEAFRESYINHTAPHLIAALEQQHDDIRKQAVKGTKNLLSGGIGGANSAQEMQGFLAAAKKADPTASDDELLSDVVLPAAERFAHQGDSARLGMAMGLLGDRFPAQRAALDLNLRAAVNRRESDIREKFNNEIDGMYGNTPVEVVRKKAETWRGKVDNSALQNKLHELDVQAHQEATARHAQQLQMEKVKAEADFNGRVDAAITAGTAYAINDETFTDSEFHEHPLDVSKAIEKNMQGRFARIDAAFPDENVRISAKADLATKNGYRPPVWTRTISAGFIALTEQGVNDDPASVPKASIQAFGLYKALVAKAPGLLESLPIDAKARDAFEAAMVLQDDPQVGPNDQQALFNARRILSGSGLSGLSEIKDQDLRDRAEGITHRTFSANAINTPEIAAQIYHRARVYVRMGEDTDKALARATELVGKGRVIINKWSQPTANALLPTAVQNQLPKIADKLIGDWVAKNGKAQGVEASDLTIKAGLTNGFWSLAHGDTGISITGEGTLFSTGDLVRTADAMSKAEQAKSDAEIIGSQNRGPRQAPTAESSRIEFLRKFLAENEPMVALGMDTNNPAVDLPLATRKANVAKAKAELAKLTKK